MGKKARRRKILKAQRKANKLGVTASEQKEAMDSYLTNLQAQQTHANRQNLQRSMHKSWAPRQRSASELRFGTGITLAMTQMHAAQQNTIQDDTLDGAEPTPTDVSAEESKTR